MTHHQNKPSILGFASGVLGLILLLPASTYAISFNFNATSSNGTSFSLDAVSDVINGRPLNLGDDYTLDMRASGNNAWTIIAPLQGNYASFEVSPFGNRSGTYTAQFLLDGLVVASDMRTNQLQSSAHVGADISFGGAGLVGTEYDQFKLTYSLLADSRAGDTTIISSIAQLFIQPTNAFYNSRTSTFGEQTTPAIPEPTTMLLFGTGLLGLAGYRWQQRRREGTQVG